MAKKNAKAQTSKLRKIAFGSVIAVFVLIMGVLISLNAKPTFTPDIDLSMQSATGMVAKSVSQGAPIVVNVPEEVELTENFEDSIVFEPAITGKWRTGEDPKMLVFEPRKPLEIGMTYSVSMPYAEHDLEEYFEIVPAPKVVSILPHNETEAHENSEITILFNRPMVPLTTLDELDTMTDGVELSPKTEGKWKWISTKALQFQPEEHLVRSSNYTVSTKSSLRSLDGLTLEPFEHSFITRPLRANASYLDEVVYNKPYVISFNQPVDLERTKKEISVHNNLLSKDVDFVAEYHEQKVWNSELKEYETKTSDSKIAVFPKVDSHGRPLFWDYSTNYSISLDNAYPVEGDINLEESFFDLFSTTPLLKSTFANSERSDYATPEFFDPEGQLELSFYEEIDINKSTITSQDLAKVEYAQICDETKESTYSDGEEVCEKIDDKTRLLLSFNLPDAPLSVSEVVLKSIVNTDGIVVNAEPEMIRLTTPPAFEVKSMKAGEYSAQQLVICSSTPLRVPRFKVDEDSDEIAEDISSFLTSPTPFVFNSWGSSSFVTRGNLNYYGCNAGEFYTRISYGLDPHITYQLNLNAEDVYGAKASHSTSIVSAGIASYDRSFYHLQDKFTITTPGHTKLAFGVENIPYADVSICKLEAERALELLNNSIDYRSPVNSGDCTESKNLKLDITNSYWALKYFNFDLADYIENPLGHYVVSFTHPEYRDWGDDQVYEHMMLNVTNLSVVEKGVDTYENKYTTAHERMTSKQKTDLKGMYWITDISSLQPEAKANIAIYTEDDNGLQKREFSTRTNSEGIARVPLIPGRMGVIVTKDDDSAVVPDRESELSWARSAFNSEKIYTYTDRPIYRPGDTVHIKGIYRLGYDDHLGYNPGEKITIKVMDNNYDDIFEGEAKLNSYGTFTFDYVLDANASLGTYMLRIGKDQYTVARFDVEEYAPAPFKVESSVDKDEYMDGDTFKVNVDAAYFFGAPVESGTVEYSVAAQDYHFDKYTDGYYSFGLPWYYCWYECSSSDSFVTRGEAQIDAKGHATISEMIDLDVLNDDDDEDESPASKIFIVDMTVTNPNGQQVSSQQSFIVHAGEVYMGVRTNKYYIAENESFDVEVKSVDTDGEEVSVKNAELSVGKVNWIYHKRKEVDGGYYHRSEKQVEEVKSMKFATDASGDYSTSLKLDESGQYEVSVKYTDSKGNAIKTQRTVYIHGKSRAGSTRLIRPSNDTSLEIVNESGSLNVGDTASFMIKNPFESGKTRALIAIERGEILDYEILTIDGPFYNYEFTVKDRHIPNVYASVVLLSDTPGLKFGSTQFRVNTDTKELNVEITPGKENYLPGEQVEMDIKVTDNDGNGVRSEISVAVVDMSVLALKGNPKKNPVKFYYNSLPLTVETSANLKNLLHEIDVKTGKGGGGGGEDLENKKRGEFKDTALWRGAIETDNNGNAHITFTLPDNLTTWQIESLGVTKDTKVGVDYAEIMSQKRLSVIPLKPRFVIPGDEFMIGGKVVNQSGSSQKVTVEISSETLELPGKTSTSIGLDAGEIKNVYFDVIAPHDMEYGEHVFELSAKGKNLSDTVENSIDITRNTTYESVATSGATKSTFAHEFLFLPDYIVADRGKVEINSSATLAVFLNEGLNALLSFPHGCTEQVASKLYSIGIVKQGLDLENIEEQFDIEEISFDGDNYTLEETISLGLARIYENQNDDGGFGFYKNMHSNFYVTVRTLLALGQLERTGVDVDVSAMKDAAGFIVSYINYPPYDAEVSIQNVIFAMDALVSSKHTSALAGQFAPRVKTEIIDNAAEMENISNMSLATLATLLAKDPGQFTAPEEDKVFKALENRLRIDARGAFLPHGASDWMYFGTSERSTAQALLAFSMAERESETIPNLVRYLLKSRSKDGSWGSTATNLTVVNAFTEYMDWQKENKADFTLAIELNAEEIARYEFNNKNFLEQKSETVSPLESLPLNTLFPLQFSKENEGGNGPFNFYYDVMLTYFLPADHIPSRDEGFVVKRQLFHTDDEEMSNPVESAQVGDILHGVLEITVPEGRNFVSVEDYIPAGTELINFDFATESRALVGAEEENPYYYEPDKFPADREELRDDQLFLFAERVRPGTYTYDYYLRVLVPGEYHHLPAVASEMYFPENFGRTSGGMFTVDN